MIDQKKFATIALVLDKEAFVMHVAYLKAKMSIHAAQKA